MNAMRGCNLRGPTFAARPTRPDLRGPTYAARPTRPDLRGPTYAARPTRPDLRGPSLRFGCERSALPECAKLVIVWITFKNK